MQESSKKFLAELLEHHSPSGWEAPIQKFWAKHLEKTADEIISDAYGNTCAILNPKGSPKIVVVGHSDEVGFQVQYISDEGFLYFQSIGGPDFKIARGQRVFIHTRRGPVPGVIGSLAAHLQDKSSSEKPPEIHDLFIDIGVSKGEEAKQLVDIGDPVTYQAGVQQLNSKVWVARGCDNRIGIFAAAETLLKCARHDKKPNACIIAVSTIQEENGLYGAGMIAHSLKPDAAIVVDVGHATDVPLCDPKKHGQVKLGGGPMLSRGSCNHPILVENLAHVAKTEKIPVQWAIDPRRSGTDADAIFTQRGGIPSAVVGLPNRYMHTPVEMIHLDDLDRISDLISSLCMRCGKNQKFETKII